MASCVSVEPVSGETANAYFEPICQLYLSVFSSPPLSRPIEKLRTQRCTLARLIDKPTFGLAVATEAGRLVGFAYGHGLGSDTHWWDDFLMPLAVETMREWDGRTFVVIDMAVAPTHQFRGIGKRLLSTLLASRPEERASLAVVVGNEGAERFYRHLGWRLAGRAKGAPQHVAPFFDIYILPLKN
jgi:GNAT superfamily N-acetyltransferase